MGFFSWECCKCKKPILNKHCAEGGYEPFSRITVVLPGGTVSGVYEGYGNLSNETSSDLRFYDGFMGPEKEPRVFHTPCYNGEVFEKIEPARNDEGQGYFHSSPNLEKHFGLPGRQSPPLAREDML